MMENIAESAENQEKILECQNVWGKMYGENAKKGKQISESARKILGCPENFLVIKKWQEKILGLWGNFLNVLEKF